MPACGKTVSWEEIKTEVDSTSSKGELRKTHENCTKLGGCWRNEACFTLKDVRFKIDHNYR